MLLSNHLTIKVLRHQSLFLLQNCSLANFSPAVIFSILYDSDSKIYNLLLLLLTQTKTLKYVYTLSDMCTCVPFIIQIIKNLPTLLYSKPKKTCPKFIENITNQIDIFNNLSIKHYIQQIKNSSNKALNQNLVHNSKIVLPTLNPFRYIHLYIVYAKKSFP